MCVARLCLTCKSTLLPEPIKTCGGKRGGMWRGREGRREGRGERRGEKGQKPSLASFCLPPCLASPGFQSILRNQQFLPILHFPFNSSSLDCPPSDDCTSVVLCPSSWRNLNRDTKFQGRGRRQTSLPASHPQLGHVPKHRGGARERQPPGQSEGLYYTLAFPPKSRIPAHLHMISVCTHEPMCLCT